MSAFVSVTRLRLRSIRFVPGFAWRAPRTLMQARAAPGFRHGEVMRDRRWTFWTLTVWDSLEDMRAYMTSGAHLAAMPKLLDWGDEASVVHWTQDSDAPPSWPEAARRMRAEGRASKVRHPSPDHAAMTFPDPHPMGGTTVGPA